MKLNRKWLHEEFVDLSHVSDKEYVEKLTVFGQKVETYERMDAEIKNVKVGKVVSIVRHTNSDHMWICQVDVGEVGCNKYHSLAWRIARLQVWMVNFTCF